MPTSVAGSLRKFIAKREVAERYGVTTRTVDRWVKDEILPPSGRQVNGRHYWDQAVLEQHDRNSTASKTAR
jgi:DNA-binding transcriptional MerR regulator